MNRSSKYQLTKNHSQSTTYDNFCGINESMKEYENLILQNTWLKSQIAKKYKLLQDQTCYTNTHEQNSNFGYDRISQDIMLTQLKKRNKFLEEKNTQLINQQRKQAHDIYKIEHSQKWRNKFQCCPQKCYHKKYIQLLRIKSPLL